MKTKLPPVLEAKLVDFRRRVWVLKLTEGLFAAVFGIALSYLVVFVLDRFLETSAWLRLVLLISGATTLGLGLPLKWHSWVWRQRRLEDAARLLRRTFPQLGDQLLGIVELARLDTGTAGRSERLVQAAMAQAVAAVKDQDFSGAVPHARHRQWGWAAGGLCAMLLLAFVWVNEAAVNALARWLTPWRAVERYTFAKLEPLPRCLVVPYSEPFELPVRLAQDTRRTPDQGTGRIGRQPVVTAPQAAGTYSLNFPPQKFDAKLAVSLGDVRKSIDIQPRPRPELAELAVRLQLPGYLGYSSEQRIEVRGGSVNVVIGAKAGFEAKATRALANASMDGLPQRVEGDRILTSFAAVTEDTARKFVWKDVDGLSPRVPLVLKIRAVEDVGPRISARRDSSEQVILDSEVVAFDLTAADDFGVKTVGLEWVGSLTQPDGVSPIRGEKVAAAGSNEKREIEARATFCAVREGLSPQTVEVRAWSDDYMPERRRSYSATFVLHVLNKTDHALWLSEQFGKWLEVAKESYEREQQLHQTNKELRALSAEALDRPENRRKVAEQASAESANAARLESLTESGRSLVEQATRNDEFDAKRLESWAEMLKSLTDIASKRMPAVSDLLKQSANAAAAKAGAPGQPGKPGEDGKPGAAGEPGKIAPSLSQGGAPPASPAGAPDPKAQPSPAVPSVSDREAALGKVEEPKSGEPNVASKPSGPGKLGLPVTTLAAVPKKRAPAGDPEDAESPAQEKIESAIDAQKDLLAEFAKVSDELGEILSSLEAGTFVKRLKAASRRQQALATSINEKTMNAFGIEHAMPNEGAPLVKRAMDESVVVRVIQSDLDAYAQRKSESRYTRILESMKKAGVIEALARDGDRVSNNLTGQSISGSEFWADTLDRWAEELVAAAKSGKPDKGKSQRSLPPEIVLKVMQTLRDEIKLRDETREVENARAAVAQEKYTADAKVLAEKQTRIGANTVGAIKDIHLIPNSADDFGKELELLQAVVNVIDETENILDAPDTGPKAIAAESEVIELLLQAQREGANPGGGGGTTAGGGGGAAKASSSALAAFGPGSKAEGGVVVRPVGQATGHAGSEFPDEFKPGLDAYFNLLEGRKK